MTRPDYLIGDARTQTGLGDFGEDSFREGLEVLVRSLASEARLNATGEAVIYPRLVGHLAQRLQIEDWYRRYPEIDDVHRSMVGGPAGVAAKQLRWRSVWRSDPQCPMGERCAPR